MIKLFFHRQYLGNWCSELVLLYSNLIQDQNLIIRDDRFSSLKDNTYVSYASRIEDCDYVVLPFKWCEFDTRTKLILEDCKRHNKKLLAFFNDDSDHKINLNKEDGFLFRTSFHKSSKKDNELALPAFSDDCFSGKYISPEDITLSVGFVGLAHFQRRLCLDIISSNNSILSDFIIRQSFWGKDEVSAATAVSDFNSNVERNLFGFTCRGTGNFSYRFYQILSMGRIPLLLNTDCVLPYDELMDYKKHCVIVDERDILNIDSILEEFFNSKTKTELYEMQLSNRKLYKERLSPLGFVKNIKELLNGHL